MSFHRMFWDIETSPNIMFSWRCGSKIKLDYHNIIQERAIICICWKWEGKKRIYSLTWDEGDDKEMIEKFSEEVKRADELVAHNGDRFDLRWFNARRLYHDMDPIPASTTVDTLKIARKHFYFNSNRLDYLANLLLGEGKIKTEFDLWKNIVLKNDQTALKKMVQYCKKDVAILERVWEKLRDYELPKTHAGVAKAGVSRDRWTCPHCGSEDVKQNKKRTSARGIVSYSMKCRECWRYYAIADSVHTAYVKAKYGSASERMNRGEDHA